MQVINITVPNPTTSGSAITSSITLDRAYNRVVGVAFFEIATGGVPDNYSIGVVNSRKTIIDDINVNAWDANAGVAVSDKYYPLNESYGAGDQWTVRVIPGANTSAAMSGQLVLILESDLTELNK